MDDKEAGVRKLARDRLTWEHLAFAFALSGPYSEVHDGRVSQLSEQSVLTILRSLLTSRIVLAHPSDIGEYAGSIQACYETLLSVLGNDAAANAGWDDLGSGEASFVTHGVAITASASARKAKNLFFGIGEVLAMLLASRTSLQLQQDAGEFYAKPAHAGSRALLTGHRKVLDFGRWITDDNDETRSISRFGVHVEFEILPFLKDYAKWSFWSEWYSNLLKGAPRDGELHRLVALIDDAIWDAGPEAVAQEIERIRREMAGPAPLEREKLLTHVKHLLANPVMSESAALSAAETVERAIRAYKDEAPANCLPEGLEHLEDLPGHFRAIAQVVGTTAANKDIEEELRREIESLHAKVVKLEQDLVGARSKTLKGVISTKAAEKLGTTLGNPVFYGGIAMGVGYFFGVTPSDMTFDNLRGFIKELTRRMPKHQSHQHRACRTFMTSDVSRASAFRAGEGRCPFTPLPQCVATPARVFAPSAVAAPAGMWHNLPQVD